MAALVNYEVALVVVVVDWNQNDYLGEVSWLWLVKLLVGL